MTLQISDVEERQQNIIEDSSVKEVSNDQTEAGKFHLANAC